MVTTYPMRIPWCNIRARARSRQPCGNDIPCFADKIKALFGRAKKDDPQWKKFGLNIAAGGCAGGASLIFVYSLDYARTKLANDLKSSKKVTAYPSLDAVVVASM